LSVLAPHLGAWIAKELGPKNPVIPAFVDIGQRFTVGEGEELKAFHTAGFLGQEFGPFMIPDPSAGLESVRPPVGMTTTRLLLAALVALGGPGFVALAAAPPNLLLAIAVYWLLHNSLQTREGRAMQAMRDHELAATANGIDVRFLRLKAFALSSSIAAVGGALFAYYLSNVTSEFFGIQFAIQFIAMIIIGGMGSLPGAVVGAAVWLLLPAIINGLTAQAGNTTGLLRSVLVDHKPQLVQAIFGSLVIVLLIFAPWGIAGMASRLKARLAARWRRS
jgi:ABC-type branched-subunit amino acid transport system permease subunit